MAYRRSICTRATLFVRRCNPCYSYISHDRDNNKHDDSAHDFLAQSRSFGTYVNKSWEPTLLFHQQRLISSGNCNGLRFHRHMSTSIGEGSDKVEYLSDVAGIISDSSVEAIATHAPVASEVAVAAADSAFPVAALQYLIDNVHSFTGLNWWASIALTTLLIRGCTVPFLINQLKATVKLSIMRPRLEEIKEEMQTKGMYPEAVADGKKRMNALFKEYGVTPFTPIKGLFIQAPVFISFFFAITNMVEKMPSFKSGGAFWFTDLTVPDSMYILPVLTGLTFLINVEFNLQEGLEGNPIAGSMKKFSRAIAVLTVPFTMHFPQAIFCYWITSNLFSFAYGSVIKLPGVKKALKIPNLPVAPPPTNQNSEGYSFFKAMKQAAAASQKIATASQEQPKPAEPKTSSSAVLSQRLKSLERQVKQRKKNKKR